MPRNKNHGSLKGLQFNRTHALTPDQLAKEILDHHIPRESLNYELYLMALCREVRHRVYELEENSHGAFSEDNDEPESG